MPLRFNMTSFIRNGWLNTLRPRQNGRHFPDDIFKCIFVNENVRISIKMSLKYVPKCPINNISSLFQIKAWRRPDDKPLSEPIMASLLTHICVTRLQWVKHLASYLRWTHILSLLNCNACLYLCIYDIIWLMLRLCLMVAICSLCVLRRGSYWYSTQFKCFHQRTYLQINLMLLALCFLCINIFEANNFFKEFMKYTTQSWPWHLKFSE